jgi:hypothetical protein
MPSKFSHVVQHTHRKKRCYQSKSAVDKPCLNYQSVNVTGCGAEVYVLTIEQSK